MTYGKHRRGKRDVTFVSALLGVVIIGAIAGWRFNPSADRSPQNMAAIEQSAYYPNCNAAWAAGAAPISSGSPGYRSELDGDDDGIACEPYRKI